MYKIEKDGIFQKIELSSPVFIKDLKDRYIKYKTDLLAGIEITEYIKFVDHRVLENIKLPRYLLIKAFYTPNNQYNLNKIVFNGEIYYYLDEYKTNKDL